MRYHQARVGGRWFEQLNLAKSSIVNSKHSEVDARSRCGELSRLLSPAVRKKGLEALIKAFPSGLQAKRAARILGVSGGGSGFAQWLGAEFGLKSAVRSDGVL